MGQITGIQKMQKITTKLTISKQTVLELAALADYLTNQAEDEEVRISIPPKESFDDYAKRSIKICGLENESDDVKQCFIEGLKEGDKQLTDAYFSVQ